MDPAVIELTQALDAGLLMRDLGLEPDPWQERVLRRAAPRLLLNCCRQAGKSLATAILALHTALYRPDSLVLLLSPSLRQSGELFKKLVGCYRRLERPVPAEQETALQLLLANGSRVVSLPGQESTVRGFSGVSLLVVDEASRVPDELYYSVRPMISVSRGRLVCLSTPFGKRGFFWKEWTEGQGWERVKITAHDCPRISKEFLEEERRTHPPHWFESEYLGEFGELVTSLFTAEDIKALFQPNLEAW